jgi:hypothetical protein
MSKFLSTIASTPQTALAEAGVGIAGIIVGITVAGPLVAVASGAVGLWGGFTLIHKHAVSKP